MELFDYVFCDDIRQEMNYNQSLMGVYNDRIGIQVLKPEMMQWPLNLRLCCYLRFKFTGQDERPDRFTFSYLINNQPFGMPIRNQMRTAPDNTMASLSIAGTGISIPNAQGGSVGFTVSLYRNDKVLLQHTENHVLQVTFESMASYAN